MAAPDRQHNALQVIFSFFLGLMVHRVHRRRRLHVLSAARAALSRGAAGRSTASRRTSRASRSPAQLTAARPRRSCGELQDKIRKLEDEQQAHARSWARNTSIILIAFATLVMSISLIRSDQLKVISNGLLLGGLFTMLYGTGWIIADRDVAPPASS